MAEILVKGKPWYYEPTSYYDSERILNHEDAKYILLKTKEILDRNGITFMPAFGTLLGIVRQGGFIPGDTDMDLSIFGKDKQKLIDLIPEFEKENIIFCRCSEPWVYTFRYKSADCDFYPLIEPCWPYKCRYVKFITYYIEKSFFIETQKVNFLETQFDVPKNPEKLLVYLYGKDWRVPKSSKARIQSRLLFWFNIRDFIKRCLSYINRHYLSKICKK